MIRRIILENYMAHERTVIEPAAGLTVLVGPNNCGKSAVIHALEMICYNSDAADYAIRHGAKKAVVTVELDDEDGTPHTITWWRKERTAGYIIDGREISGIGRSSVPDDLHRYLRMPAIKSASGDEKFLVHFGMQKSPIFLLDGTGGTRAQFFASATDADKLIEMQKAHQDKVKAAKNKKKDLDAELKQLDEELETLSPLPVLAERLTGLETNHRELNELATAIGAIRQNASAIELAASSATNNALCMDALASLREPPLLGDARALAECIGLTEGAGREAVRNRVVGETLRPLGEPPAVTPTASLRQAGEEIAAALRRIAIDRGRTAVLQPLAPPTPPHDVQAMAQAIGDLAAAGDGCVKQHAHTRALSPLAAPPNLADTPRLDHSLVELEKAGAEVRRHQCGSEVLKTLDAAPRLHDTLELKQRIDGIGQLGRACQRVAGHITVLSELAPPLPPGDLAPLKESIANFETAIGSELRQREKMNLLSHQIEAFREEIEQWVEANPNCITCGQSISVELVTEGKPAFT